MGHITRQGTRALLSGQNAPAADSLHADTGALLAKLGREARIAARRLATASDAEKDMALCAMAGQIRAWSKAILTANAEDVTDAKARGQTAAFIDRLTLDLPRIG